MLPTPDLHAALRQYFEYPEFRPGQQVAVEHVLAGRDTLVVMPTGSGKSLIYQLAGLLLPGVTLVISPLVALMKDQVDGLTRRGLPATFVNSSLDGLEQSRRLRDVAAGKYKLVLVSPERLRSASFQAAISRPALSLLAVDEAHCLSQWGHDFRPDYLHLAQARRDLKVPVTVALTATATPRVQDDIVGLLGLPKAERLVTGFNRPNLSFEVHTAADLSTKMKLLAAVLREALPAQPERAPGHGLPRGGGIIYTGTRKDAENVAAYVNDRLKIPARYYHGQLDPAARSEVQEAFLSGDLPVVAATNAFGLGIDRPDVRFVIHYALPGSLEAYYQEAGRAGRDGLPARAVLLFAARDIFMHQHFIDNDTPTAEELRVVHTFLARPGAAQGVSREALPQAVSLTPVKLRVALEQLEAAGALRRLPDDGFGYDQLRVETAPLPAPALAAIAKQAAARRDHKRRQLDLMLAYAQSRACRRATLLRHFGDNSHAVAEVPVCCDVCASGQAGAPQHERPAATTADRNALVILDTVANLGWGVGKAKLAHLLKGAAALDGTGYVRAYNYGKLARVRLADLEALIAELLAGGHLQTTGGLRPVLALTPRGERTLEGGLAVTPGAPGAAKPAPSAARPTPTTGARPPNAAPWPEPGAPAEAQLLANTVLETGRLLTAGHKPEHIAAARGLTLDTIYTHLAQLIAEGQADVNAVVPPAIQAQVRQAIAQTGRLDRLAPLKARLPPSIGYGLIRCVVAAEQRSPMSREAARPAPPPAPRPVEPARPAAPAAPALDAMPAAARDRAAQMHALGEREDHAGVPALVAALEDSDGNVRRLAASALGKLRAAEAVPALLKRLAIEPRPQVKQYLLTALGRIGDERARTALEAVAEAGPAELDYNRAAARTALRALGQTALSGDD
ncbi:MAG: RecQ family ATP-dependent DNA helicase [Anaerolineales bacterium]|nr:RecQ family ATP-dependent DNA helicase [Anaerolineales bacterium]